MIPVSNFSEWRQAARILLLQGVPPPEVLWSSPSDPQPLLFEPERVSGAPSGSIPRIPRAFLDAAKAAARHSDPSRWSLLYRILWRLTHGEKHLLEVEIDDDVLALTRMRQAVEKDIYRMRAFVRFRRVQDQEGERFVAWYEPAHHTLDANGDFFVKRFGAMRWAILTPEASLIWNLQALEAAPGVPRSLAPREDEMEDLWRLYYRTIYNPARLKLDAMRAQLPVGRWKDLPEARAIPELVRLSRGRVQQMAEAQTASASAWIARGAGLPELRDAIRGCRACGLCARATQPVWGEGDPSARIMLVGEQPGDEEDRAGRPFVGPAGQVLQTALADAGIGRDRIYITNAVKAFKFEERGKRRIHQTPRASEISTCRPWLLAEIEAVRPAMIVCLGASAAQSVLGRKVRITTERGRRMEHADSHVAVTYHPSAILRSPEVGIQRELYQALVGDLACAAAVVENAASGS